MTSQRRWSQIFKIIFLCFFVLYSQCLLNDFTTPDFGGLRFWIISWLWGDHEHLERRRGEAPEVYGDHDFQRGDDIKVGPLSMFCILSRWNLSFLLHCLFVLCSQKQGNNKNMFVSSVSVLKVQTVQVHIREGDSDVRLLQEAWLLLNRMHLQSKCLQVLTLWWFLGSNAEMIDLIVDDSQGLRSSLHQRRWENPSDSHHWHNPFWGTGNFVRISWTLTLTFE